MRNKTIFIAATIILFIVSGVAGYFGPDWLRNYNAGKQREAFVPAGVPVSVVEDFARTFQSLDKATEPKHLPDVPFLDKNGKEVRISDFAGRPVLVNLWATWCAPCVIELPYLQDFAKHYEGRLDVVGIAMEQGKTGAHIASFLEKRELSDFAAYVDNSGDFGKNLGLRGIPTSFLIGSDGLILYRFEGEAVWTSRESIAFFDVFLLQKR
jgi:thiol-disulfide isomerase/thioredoxin